MAEVCSIGQLLQDQCHRVLHTRAVGFKSKADLSDNEIQLLSLRTCQDCENIVNICLHHEQVLLHRFDQLQRYCCNPFGAHGAKIANA